MRKHLSTIFLLLVLIAGVGLLVYPSFSDWWNKNMATHIIADYNQVITQADNSFIDEIWEDARAFNAYRQGGGYSLTPEEQEWYNRALNATGVGIIGYVEIPIINVSLPIYHGTSDAVLQAGIGHVDWSSLPTGDIGSHVVISGHRGLPSARLFTDLDQLTVGDTFSLEILDREFGYEIDQINIVLPYELSDLKVDPDMDLVTLVTCTPYGVNSHRLLIRGHRIELGPKYDIRIVADALQIRPALVAPFVAAPMLLILFIALLFDPGQKEEDLDDPYEQINI